MTRNRIIWVLESDVFEETHNRLRETIQNSGHDIIDWKDEWWISRDYPQIDFPIIFHGSLGNADRITKELPWKPGAYCTSRNYFCSRFYPNARPWILNTKYQLTTVKELVFNKSAVLESIEYPEKIFVRPDSPLKLFSGRVLDSNNISLDALDFGFYYDDDSIPIIVSPQQDIEKEWRFVIVDGKVVSGSGYQADGRTGRAISDNGKHWDQARLIAKQLSEPDPIYILDICLTNNEYKIVEINPFSGADLYCCKTDPITTGLEKLILE